MAEKHLAELVPLAVCRMDCRRHCHVFLGLLTETPIPGELQVWLDTDSGKYFHPIETFLISYS